MKEAGAGGPGQGFNHDEAVPGQHLDTAESGFVLDGGQSARGWRCRGNTANAFNNDQSAQTQSYLYDAASVSQK